MIHHSKGLEKHYSMKPYHRKTQKTLKIILKLSMSIKDFLITMTYYISSKKSRKVLFTDDIFDNVD